MKNILLAALFSSAFGNYVNAQFTVYTQANSGIPSDYVLCISAANNGDIWLGTDAGIVRLSGNNWSTYNFGNSFLPSDTWNEIINIGNQNWIGNSNGLGQFDGMNYSTFTDSLGDFTIWTMELDANNDLWVGTYSGGLDHYNGSTWDNYNTSNSALPDDQIEGIAFDNSGNVWCATSGGGLAKFDGTIFTVYNIGNSGIVSNSLNAVATAPNGDIWIGGPFGAISQYDGTNWTNYDSLDYGIAYSSIRTMVVDATGMLWVGTTDALMSFDGTTWTVYHTLNSNLASSTITELVIDKDAYLWMSTAWGGVAKLNTPTSIASIEPVVDFSIYPNPIFETGTVCYKGNQGEVKDIALYDVLGDQVTTYPASTKLDGLTISTQGLSAGIYFLSIRNDQGTMNRKVVVR